MSKVMTICVGVEVQLHSFLTSSLNEGECQLHGPDRYFPLGKPPLPTELEATNVRNKLRWRTWYILEGKRSALVFCWITGRGGGWEDGSV